MCFSSLKNDILKVIIGRCECMEVRIGQELEFKELDKIQKDVAERLKIKGSMQWDYILTNQEQANLKTHLSKKEVLVVEENKKIVGICYLYQEPEEWDRGLWQKEKDLKSYYLHKVMLSNDFTGGSYGEKLLSAVCAWVKTQQGEKILLDTRANVTYLNDFYKKFGFQLVGQRKKGAFDKLYSDFNLYEYQINY